MKAITLWQPWASWIAWGLKTIETRRHGRFSCLVGQRVAIHAALRWDEAAMIEAEEYLRAHPLGSLAANAIRDNVSAMHPRGRVVCTAYVYEFRRRLDDADSQAALCWCGDGDRSGLFLGDVRLVAADTPLGRRRPGGRGIFEVEETDE
jgi:hypothetical protein